MEFESESRAWITRMDGPETWQTSYSDLTVTVQRPAPSQAGVAALAGRESVRYERSDEDTRGWHARVLALGGLVHELRGWHARVLALV